MDVRDHSGAVADRSGVRKPGVRRVGPSACRGHDRSHRPVDATHGHRYLPRWQHQPLDDEVSVHLMEHGNLIAWYSCGSGGDCGAIRDTG